VSRQDPAYPAYLSFSPRTHRVSVCSDMHEMMMLVRSRYNFTGKSGVAVCCADGDEAAMPDLVASHRAGEGLGDFDVPSCDFCLWLRGFSDEVNRNRGVAEAKLAEASFRCKTLFFSPGLSRPVEETVLRHTRYEHAKELGRVGGRPVYMCW